MDGGECKQKVTASLVVTDLRKVEVAVLGSCP